MKEEHTQTHAKRREGWKGPLEAKERWRKRAEGRKIKKTWRNRGHEGRGRGLFTPGRLLQLFPFHSSLVELKVKREKKDADGSRQD